MPGRKRADESASILKCIKEHDIVGLKKALHRGDDPNVKSGDGETALKLALESDNEETMLAVISAPRLVVTTDDVLSAIGYGSSSKATSLLLSHKSLAKIDRDQWREFLMACMDGSNIHDHQLHALLGHPLSAKFRSNPSVYSEVILRDFLCELSWESRPVPKDVMKAVFTVPDLPINASAPNEGPILTLLFRGDWSLGNCLGDTLGYAQHPWTMLQPILTYPGLLPHKKDAKGRSTLMLAAAFHETEVKDDQVGDVLLATVKCLCELEVPPLPDLQAALDSATKSGKVLMARWLETYMQGLARSPATASTAGGTARDAAPAAAAPASAVLQPVTDGARAQAKAFWSQWGEGDAAAPPAPTLTDEVTRIILQYAQVASDSEPTLSALLARLSDGKPLYPSLAHMRQQDLAILLASGQRLQLRSELIDRVDAELAVHQLGAATRSDVPAWLTEHPALVQWLSIPVEAINKASIQQPLWPQQKDGTGDDVDMQDQAEALCTPAILAEAILCIRRPGAGVAGRTLASSSSSSASSSASSNTSVWCNLPAFLLAALDPSYSSRGDDLDLGVTLQVALQMSQFTSLLLGDIAAADRLWADGVRFHAKQIVKGTPWSGYQLTGTFEPVFDEFLMALHPVARAVDERARALRSAGLAAADYDCATVLEWFCGRYKPTMRAWLLYTGNSWASLLSASGLVSGLRWYLDHFPTMDGIKALKPSTKAVKASKARAKKEEAIREDQYVPTDDEEVSTWLTDTTQEEWEENMRTFTELVLCQLVQGSRIESEHKAEAVFACFTLFADHPVTRSTFPWQTVAEVAVSQAAVEALAWLVTRAEHKAIPTGEVKWEQVKKELAEELKSEGYGSEPCAFAISSPRPGHAVSRGTGTGTGTGTAALQSPTASVLTQADQLRAWLASPEAAALQ